MPEEVRWQDPTVSDLALAMEHITAALELVRQAPPDLQTDRVSRDVTVIKVQEALWWTEALRDAAKKQWP